MAISEALLTEAELMARALREERTPLEKPKRRADRTNQRKWSPG